MDDTQTKLKRHEQWLIILRVLAVICLIAGLIFLYRYIKTDQNPAPMALFLLSSIMFFMAYREKSHDPKPGSPEYEARERAEEAKINAKKERLYRRDHPFMVARELVDQNKAENKNSKSNKK